ncbi:hypothetical protein NQ317_008091 [Molorchus minor]|uniref:Secreted protein n=1 Tax=Molorchus minor TaxID=1323400 RepID=A0ABQ9JDE5_9CUCU|nr:hypothetical protein NQ317_008091 [Molorchus minor]
MLSPLVSGMLLQLALVCGSCYSNINGKWVEVRDCLTYLHCASWTPLKQLATVHEMDMKVLSLHFFDTRKGKLFRKSRGFVQFYA